MIKTFANFLLTNIYCLRTNIRVWLLLTFVLNINLNN